MRGKKCVVVAAATGMMTIGIGATAVANAPLAVIRAIQPGMWSVQEVGTTEPATRLCVRDAGMLFQVRHATAQCDRLVLEYKPNQATVDYSCRGFGQGRTTIRLAGPGVAQIATQGVADGAPFDTRYEVRRLGNCPR